MWEWDYDTERLRYVAKAQTQLFKALVRQWEQLRSVVLSAGGQEQWQMEDRIHLSLKVRKEEVCAAAGPSVKEDVVEMGLG